ncbi:MAG: hypothetical protein V3V61_05605 [Gammaproteobacteria bacterium]
MWQWMRNLLESVLGKRIFNFLGALILGAIVVTMLPSYLVTSNAFAKEVDSIYQRITRGDQWQELKLLELQKDVWTRRLWDLEDKIDSQGSATTRQQSRLEEARQEIERLKAEEAKIKKNLGERPE